jgi:hypothetical protein
MPSEETGLIRVQEVESEEVLAQHVDFFLTIKGASLIVGDAALNIAREVQQLITELKTLGVTDAEIKLLGVQADVSTGILGRNSSATYHLKVHCARLEALPDFLGVITSQKNVAVDYLEWNYGDLRGVQEQLLDRCIERANEKAQRIARGLHVTIVGVYDCKDYFSEHPSGTYTSETGLRLWLKISVGRGRTDDSEASRTRDSGKRRVTIREMEMQIPHSTQVVIGMNIDYRVAPQQQQTRAGELEESA